MARYWVGGTGDWSAGNTANWSATSGGAGGQSVPTFSDDVFLDGNSGGGIITITSLYPASCNNFNTTGYGGTVKFILSNLNIYGSAVMPTAWINNPISALNFRATTSGQTIDFGSQQYYAVTFNGSGGEWTFQSALLASGPFTITTGSVITAGYAITSESVIVAASGTFTLSSSLITCTGLKWQCNSSATLSAGTSVIKSTWASSSTFTFAGGGKTYNTVWFDRGAGTGSIAISGSNTITELKDTGTVSHTVNFTEGTTQTVTTFTFSGSAGKTFSLASTTTGVAWTLSKTSGTVSCDYLSLRDSTASGGAQFFAGANSTNVSGNTGWTFTAPPPPTVTTQAVSSIAAITATGNGNITAIGGGTPDERGVVWSTATHADPGNTAPGSSLYSGLANETGSFTTGAFTESMTGLVSRTTYYVRAYAHNLSGYSYGSEVSFTTLGFTNPGNVYTSDNTYATFAATSGDLTVEISKDGGTTYGNALTKTFTGSDSLLTYGNGATELWGSSYTRADVVDANLRVRLSQGNTSQVYKTFGFTTGSDILTGIEVAVEAKYASATMSIDLLEVKIYYGQVTIPVQAGSQAFASDGRKNGEGAGAGTGVLAYYDGTAWRATDTGATVAA